MTIKSFIGFLKHPSHLANAVITAMGPFIKSDEKFIKMKWATLMNYPLNLENPQTFNEKLNWLKLNDHRPIYSQLADKYVVKSYVESKIGKDYLVKNYGSWESVDDIDFNKLPDKFVIKTNNDSSGVIICKDKSTFDIEKYRKKLQTSLKRDYYYNHREFGYKGIKPLIIIDEFLDDHSGHELTDYKFWCFNGEPKIMYCTNKASSVFENFYDMEFNPIMDINHGFVRKKPEFSKPKSFEEMKKLCKLLLRGESFPFVRIDFFYVNEHIYFGEFTFYDWAGLRPFTDPAVDAKLGEMISLDSLQVK